MRRFFVKSRFLVLIPLFLLAECYYDKEEILYPESGQCNATGTATFTQDVWPILSAKCNNCHSGGFASAGIRLDTYNEVLKQVNNGKLMGSINHSQGFSPMPKNTGKMSACQIQKIQNWIDSGPVNN